MENYTPYQCIFDVEQNDISPSNSNMINATLSLTSIAFCFRTMCSQFVLKDLNKNTKEYLLYYEREDEKLEPPLAFSLRINDEASELHIYLE